MVDGWVMVIGMDIKGREKINYEKIQHLILPYFYSSKKEIMVKTLTWTDCGLPEVSKILNAATVTKGGLVYTSGSVGINADGTVPESVEEQTEIAIKNLEIVLKAAGSSIDSIVKVLIFVTDASYVAPMNETYAKYFKTKPSRSCVIAALAGAALKVEIEVVAELE